MSHTSYRYRCHCDLEQASGICLHLGLRPAFAARAPPVIQPHVARSFGPRVFGQRNDKQRLEQQARAARAAARMAA